MHASRRPYSKSIVGQAGKPEEAFLRRVRLLTRMIHDIVIELDFVPIRKDGLERGNSTFDGFRPRNRHDLVRVDQSIGVLEKKKNSRGHSYRDDPEEFVVVTRTGYAM
jgi:hypothetical protein